jgi:hypothetical protein
VFVIVFPVVAAVYLRSTVYDGARQFLFIVPPLAALAGAGLSTALDALSTNVARTGLAMMVGALIVLVGMDMIQLHPYEALYYNRSIAGGLRGANGRFETDYWGTSYREAAEWLMSNYHPATDEPIRVANCNSDFLTSYFFEKGPAATRRFVPASGSPPHVFIATTRWNCHQKSFGHGRLLHIVQRQDVPLAYIFEQRQPEPQRP